MPCQHFVLSGLDNAPARGIFPACRLPASLWPSKIFCQSAACAPHSAQWHTAITSPRLLIFLSSASRQPGALSMQNPTRPSLVREPIPSMMSSDLPGTPGTQHFRRQDPREARPLHSRPGWRGLQPDLILVARCATRRASARLWGCVPARAASRQTQARPHSIV